VISEKGRKHLPPYVSYRTFYNFLERLQQRVPSRIDRSYWGDLLSGSTGTQLMAALRFLNLIDVNGKPTEKLKPLVAAKGDIRTQLLRKITNESYNFVCGSSLDLGNATYAELRDVFHENFRLTDDVSRKCVKFFIALAKDSGMTLSPFITKGIRSTHTTSSIKATTKRTVTKTSRNAIIPQGEDEIPNTDSYIHLLLSKFPNFDPSWSDEIKLKWFADFDELLKMRRDKR
jgi:hypothetical protein